MKHLVVASTYAAWLVLINVVFYLVHGRELGPQEYSVLAGVVPMGLQLLLLGFDPVGMMRPARMMCLFVLIVLLSYLFNGADWSGVVYVVELLYLSAVTILVAGCPDRRLLPTIAELYSLPTAIWLLYIDFFGKYEWGRLVEGRLESNAWGLIGLSVGVASFAHRSRITGAFCFAVCCLTIYDASSRSSIVGLTIAVGLIGIRTMFDLRNRRLIGAFAILSLGLAFAVVLVPSLRDSASDFAVNLLKLDDPYRGINSGSSGRDELWRAAIGLWWDHPWFGVGFRMHEAYLPLNFSAHNAYLAMLADTGIFGFLWYMALMVAAWIGMFRMKDSRMRRLAIALVSSYAFIGLFERRAINGANPMSLMFLMAAMAILREDAVTRVQRAVERTRQAWSPPPVLRAGGGAASPS
jgi:O-antigen ligase